MPTIRGVHEHMSTWMSSLIDAQDGCLQMVAHRASMGRSQQEHLAQQVAQRSAMPSTNNQVAYLRAQLALRDAQIEQVKAERDNHFVQEEEVIAHMRLLSSEVKDWKSRVVTEVEEVLCRESPQMAQQATEAQEARSIQSVHQECMLPWIILGREMQRRRQEILQAQQSESRILIDDKEIDGINMENHPLQPHQRHISRVIMYIASQLGDRMSLLIEIRGQLNPIDSKRPIEVMANGPDGQVTSDSHSRTTTLCLRWTVT